jgi:hypothetical protein
MGGNVWGVICGTGTRVWGGRGLGRRMTLYDGVTYTCATARKYGVTPSLRVDSCGDIRVQVRYRYSTLLAERWSCVQASTLQSGRRQQAAHLHAQSGSTDSLLEPTPLTADYPVSLTRPRQHEQEAKSHTLSQHKRKQGYIHEH